MSNEQTEFAEFFRGSWEPCLRAELDGGGGGANCPWLTTT